MEGAVLKAEAHDAPESDLVEPERARSAPVLVAVDFSSESEAALLWAAEYAECSGAPLEVLHVVHDPADAPGTYKPDNADPLEPMVDVASDRLDEVLDRVAREHPDLKALADAKRHCIEGLPGSTIVDMERTRDARLLVLGGRRRNGLSRLLHASTAHQVAGKSRAPVTIVKSRG